MAAKIPVIIDTDPGVDDALAILLAIASPELEILAFIISFGNTDVEASYLNILKIFQAISRHLEQYPEDKHRFPNFDTLRKPFLAKGASRPLEGELHSAHYFHGRDGLGGITERHPELNVDLTNQSWLQPTDKPGAELALELIRSHPAGSITYLALGPVTNLASLLRLDPTTVRDRIGRVFCMGGTLDVPGNTNPVSEFNFFADPYAVKELLTPTDPGAGLPLDLFFLLSLDITTPHILPFPLYKDHVDPAFDSTANPSKSEGKSPVAHFTSSFFERTREVMQGFGTDAMELHDIVAVWCAIENSRISGNDQNGLPKLAKGWEGTRRLFTVERTGELTRGMLVVDRRNDKGAYAPGANRAAVQAELEKQHMHHGLLESTALPAPTGIESPPKSRKDGSGVMCITATPGCDSLQRIILERVWGVTRK